MLLVIFLAVGFSEELADIHLTLFLNFRRIHFKDHSASHGRFYLGIEAIFRPGLELLLRRVFDFMYGEAGWLTFRFLHHAGRFFSMIGSLEPMALVDCRRPWKTSRRSARWAHSRSSALLDIRNTVFRLKPSPMLFAWGRGLRRRGARDLINAGKHEWEDCQANRFYRPLPRSAPTKFEVTIFFLVAFIMQNFFLRSGGWTDLVFSLNVFWNRLYPWPPGFFPFRNFQKTTSLRFFFFFFFPFLLFFFFGTASNRVLVWFIRTEVDIPDRPSRLFFFFGVKNIKLLCVQVFLVEFSLFTPFFFSSISRAYYRPRYVA